MINIDVKEKKHCRACGSVTVHNREDVCLHCGGKDITHLTDHGKQVEPKDIHDAKVYYTGGILNFIYGTRP